MTHFNPVAENSEVQEEFGQMAHMTREGAVDPGAARSVERAVERSLRNDARKRKSDVEEGSEKRRRLSERRLEGLTTMTRDDAFQLGAVARSRFADELMLEMGDEARAELEFEEDREVSSKVEEILSDADYEEIKTIEEDRSSLVGSQVFEIYHIAESQRGAHPRAANQIKKFALELAKSLPEKTVEVIDESVELDDSYLGMAKQMSGQLGFELPDEEIRKLAYRLQMSKADQEDEDGKMEDVDDEEEQTPEEQVKRTLGNLIFIAERDIVRAAGCLPDDGESDVEDRILEASHDIMQEAVGSIRLHEREHERTALQDIDQAVFSRMTVEIAKLLMLDSGGFNFGIIDDVAENLVPEHLEETEAAMNMMIVLAKMSQDSRLWVMLSRGEKPESEDLPSNELIRAILGLRPSDEITDKHVQVVMLSAVMDHIRQAKAGTCFATSWMIQIMFDHLDLALMDFADVIRQGSMKRVLFSESREFPFFAHMPRGSLDTLVTVDQHGKMLAVREYEVNADQESTKQQPHHSAYLSEAPGMIAACRALGMDDVQEVITEALQNMGKTQFYVREFLTEIAKVSYQRRNAIRYDLRDLDKRPLDHLERKAQYAFNAQAENPMHRAWEQIMTSLVDYFNSQYMWPHWTFDALELAFEGTWKREDPAFKRDFKKLMDNLFLPMITRMRYRYNPDMDDEQTIFEDASAAGTRDFGNYGYELCDAGLPDDFQYSKDLRREIKSHTHFISLQRFEEYQSPHDWKPVNSPELFQEFLENLIRETTGHLISEEPGKSAEWNAVAEKVSGRIHSETFLRGMIEYQFGKVSDQRKELRRNENTLSTTPWKFRWGGDYKEVQNSYFSFKKHPTQEIHHTGTAKSVLAWQINYMKKQPAEIQQQWGNPFAKTVMTAPVHAFLFTPGEPTFMQAWTSEVDTNDYVQEVVEEPGMAVAEAPISRTAQRQLVDFVASNYWVRPCDEKHHLDRQELTDTSKAIFDRILASKSSLYHMKLGELRSTLLDAVIDSRARDPKVGKRYRPWEETFKRRLNNEIKALVPDAADGSRLTRETVRSLINFVRNRKDRLALSPEGAQRFRSEAQELPSGMSNTEYRKALVEIAQRVHQEEIASGVKDKFWLEKFVPLLDNKLLSILNPGQVQQLMNSAICTSDTNWRDGIHAIHFIFMVNPGSGEIELCRWVPDTSEVGFMEQTAWFPKKEGHDWNLPKNYHVFEHEPMVRIKELVEV